MISAGTDPHYIAASDEAALLYEQLQTDLGKGPCLAAYTSGLAVSIPDLRTDERFPRFAERALRAGVRGAVRGPGRRGPGGCRGPPCRPCLLYQAANESDLLDLAVNVSAVQLMGAGYVSSVETVMT